MPAAPSKVLTVRYVNRDGDSSEYQIESKWCYSCNNYRPFRGVHCRFCDVCVCRRDHHCPWTGICVGGRNYLRYFCMIWCCFVLTLVAFIGGIHSFVRKMGRCSNNVFLCALTDTYCLEFILILLALFWAFLVGSLSFYHTYLICKNATSGDKSKRNSGETFNSGSVISNIKASLCFKADDELYTETLEDAVIDEVTVVNL
ncbi:hypothetical protein AGDE_08210 [Angomonas deanei]|nr:hypothetical protein AGDE_08210 [Angomonas deanei]|eukprot:EPY33585.1 hypothetical protein AGDE_08210 [Angomonas deanei]